MYTSEPILKSPPDLPALARSLEIPDCGCPFGLVPSCEAAGQPCPTARGDKGVCCCPWVPAQPPCEHILDTWHDLTVREWAELLLAILPRSPHPASAADRPLYPGAGGRVLNRRARVALYALRQRAGFHLYHPADRWRRTHALEVRVAPVGGHLANGADDPDSLSLTEGQCA